MTDKSKLRVVPKDAPPDEPRSGVTLHKIEPKLRGCVTVTNLRDYGGELDLIGHVDIAGIKIDDVQFNGATDENDQEHHELKFPYFVEVVDVQVYDRIRDDFAYLLKWIGEHGYAVIAPPRLPLPPPTGMDDFGDFGPDDVPY